MSFRPLLLAAFLPALLGGCLSREGEVDFRQGGIRVARSACPAIGVPAQTGDVTLFDPPSSRDARAIDVTAVISNLRTTCDESGAEVIANVTFDVTARRRDSAQPRQVVLPYFVTVVRGGTVVYAKRVSRVAIDFAAGQDRVTTTAAGSTAIARSAATLPEEVRRQITRRRKAGDEDAAIDPLAEPGVRAAVARATFELLVGFQLTPDQLQYNVTR